METADKMTGSSPLRHTFMTGQYQAPIQSSIISDSIVEKRRTNRVLGSCLGVPASGIGISVVGICRLSSN